LKLKKTPKKTPQKFEDYDVSPKKEDENFEIIKDTPVETIKKENDIEEIKKPKLTDKKSLLERLRKTMTETTNVLIENKKEIEIKKEEEKIEIKKTPKKTPPKKTPKKTPKSSSKKRGISEIGDIETPEKKKQKTPSSKDAKRPKRNKLKIENFDIKFGDLPDDLKESYKILQEVKKHEWAWPFLEPVNIVALNIPDYFSVIKNPMDLQNLEINLLNKKYDSISQFAADMRRIWTNCYTYNAPETDISLMARKLDSFFEDKFKRISDSTDTSFYKNKVMEMEHQLESMKEKLEVKTPIKKKNSY